MAEAWKLVAPFLLHAFSTAVGMVAAIGLAVWGLGKDGLLEFWKGKLKLVNDKDLEQFKATQQRENEQLRAELAIVTATVSSQHSSLNEKIAEVVAGTYARLVKVQQTVAAYVSIVESVNGPSRQERLDAVNAAFHGFFEFYSAHRLYLSKSTIGKVREFEKLLYDTALEFQWLVDFPSRNGQRGEPVWAKIDNTMQKRVPELLEALDDEFRMVLGLDAIHRRWRDEPDTAASNKLVA